MSGVTPGSLDNGSPNHILSSYQHSAGSKETLSGVRNRGNMLFRQREHPPQIGDNDVSTNWQSDFGGNILEELDLARALVGRGNLPGHLNDWTWLYREYSASPKLAGKDRHDARSRADIYNDGARSNRRPKGLGIGVHADTVGKHVAVVTEVVCIHRHFRGSIANRSHLPESG